jgi:hypothetical protein
MPQKIYAYDRKLDLGQQKRPNKKAAVEREG